MASIFSKIVDGSIPCHKVYEDDDCLAFLDINPNTIGHTLCIPKKEIDNLFNLDDDLYTGLMNFSKKVATAMKKALDCQRIGVSVVGFEVPHAHVHLIPINKIEDMYFNNIVKLTNEEFISVADKIKSYL